MKHIVNLEYWLTEYDVMKMLDQSNRLSSAQNSEYIETGVCVLLVKSRAGLMHHSACMRVRSNIWCRSSEESRWKGEECILHDRGC
jgi:hypothetical protein